MAELKAVVARDAEVLRAFIGDTVRHAGCENAVVGLSGGVDSAVAAKLCVDALGGSHVICIFMPTAATPADDYRQVRAMCRTWGAELLTVSVQPAVDAFAGMLLTGPSAPLERGNIAARCRMVVLYDRAKKRRALVVGTTNRSELMMGYMTKFGDGAEDLMPLCRLYKTQVWALARMIGIPEEIVAKVPTAGLWEGQTDEGEMGITYHDLDLALNAMEHGGDDAAMAAAAGITAAKAAELRAQVQATEHKRQPAAAPAADPNI